MMLLSILDPVGVKTRKGKRLRRRRYYKVACVYVHCTNESSTVHGLCMPVYWMIISNSWSELQGPNWVWHLNLDGYDKLKPYGFPIHGCIDG